MYKKNLHPTFISFQTQLYASLTAIWTNKGPYYIVNMVIYVTLIKMTMKMYLSTIAAVLSFSLFFGFKIFNFEQIQINMLWI